MANEMENDPTVDTTQADATPEGAPEPQALAALVAERDEFKDRVLRTLAEMENLLSLIHI